MSMTITKSEYIMFLTHPAYLWLKKFNKRKLPPTDEATQAIFDAGNLFESYAEKLFPNAIKIGFEVGNLDTYKSMPQRTQDALYSGAQVILQGRLEANNTTCIFDVLKRVEGKTFDLIEIKSSSSAKIEHHYDLAFQKQLLEGAGLNVRNSSVIHINSDYVRKGEIDVKELTTETDVTEEVNALEELTKEQIKEAFNILESTKCPDISPRYINKLEVPGVKWKDYWMKIFFYINKDISDTSIYKLCRLNSELIGKLEDLGIKEIKDIPENLEGLHPKQISQIQVTKTGERIIDRESIKEFLESFEYPLYFFDYETFMDVIPRFDGLGAYKQYPFQYSLHILESPDGELKHKEYLHSENSNPMPELIEKMKKDLGDKGNILTWNMSFEKNCNERMAKVYPEYEEYLAKINDRINDLMIPFSKQWFIDKNFYGSASIKYILPALVPQLKHSDLTVSEGSHASRLWKKTILEGENMWSKEKIIKDLIDYCNLDTFAIVEIFRYLNNLKALS